MAETRKITIEIIDSEAKPKTEIQNKQEKNNTSDDKSSKKSTALNNAGTMIVINQAYKQLRGSIISNADYLINRHFNLTDDYIGQRNYNITKNIISKVRGTALGVVAGFTTGGPVGAAITAAMSIGLTAIDIAKNFDEQNIMLRQMDAQLEYTRQRAGYSLTSGSVGENR